MRALTVCQLKGKHARPTQKEPREGTKLRSVYDRFMANKGGLIDLAVSQHKGAVNSGDLDQLRNYYGLDIRHMGYRRWVLAGEWFGKVYVDYVAERIAAVEKAA